MPMFFLIVALSLHGVEAGASPTISGYDCSTPKDLESWETADSLVEMGDYWSPIDKVYTGVGSLGCWIILIQGGVWLLQTFWRTRRYV